MKHGLILFLLLAGSSVGLHAEDARPVVDASNLTDEAAADTSLPTLYLVGDSTVRIGGASSEMIGWGERILPYFDSKKINVVNKAIGGRSARTFYTEGRWDDVEKALRPGDVVIIQFGHNDQGRIGDPANKHRADGRGTGPETVPDTMPDGSIEQVHTFGWYMAHFVKTARAREATVILCSPIPHKDRWESDRDFSDIASWDRQVADEHGALFLDLTLVITDAYHVVGKQAVEGFFADQRTHTNEDGAVFNAECVIAGLKSLPGDPLAPYYSRQGQAVQRHGN